MVGVVSLMIPSSFTIDNRHFVIQWTTGYFQIQELRDHQVAAIRALGEGNYVFTRIKIGSDKSLAYECFPLDVRRDW